MCQSIISVIFIIYNNEFDYLCFINIIGFGLNDYTAIVKKPMDLGTIKDNLEKDLYRTE